MKTTAFEAFPKNDGNLVNVFLLHAEYCSRPGPMLFEAIHDESNRRRCRPGAALPDRFETVSKDRLFMPKNADKNIIPPKFLLDALTGRSVWLLQALAVPSIDVRPLITY